MTLEKEPFTGTKHDAYRLLYNLAQDTRSEARLDGYLGFQLLKDQDGNLPETAEQAAQIILHRYYPGPEPISPDRAQTMRNTLIMSGTGSASSLATLLTTIRDVGMTTNGTRDNWPYQSSKTSNLNDLQDGRKMIEKMQEIQTSFQPGIPLNVNPGFCYVAFDYLFDLEANKFSLADAKAFGGDFADQAGRKFADQADLLTAAIGSAEPESLVNLRRMQECFDPNYARYDLANKVAPHIRANDAVIGRTIMFNKFQEDILGKKDALRMVARGKAFYDGAKAKTSLWQRLTSRLG